MPAIELKPGRKKSLLRRHPWVFSGAVARLEGSCSAGETVDIRSSQGTFLGRGGYSPTSQIRVRVWTFADEQVGPGFFKARLQRAVAYRTKLLDSDRFDAYRLVNSESDGLPGIVVDRYAGFLVCQFLSAGAEFWKNVVVEQLKRLFPEAGIYERSDAEVRAKEGLPQVSSVLHGEEPPNLIEIKEDALRFLVDVKTGHKTGFYLDQRDNRISVCEYCKAAEVLNDFACTGAFCAWALHGGAAKVTNIESSPAALALAEQNVKLNGFDASRKENIRGDMFQLLRQFRNTGRQFDVVILDPPRFVDCKGHLQRAARAYKDINLLALKLVRRGGLSSRFLARGFCRQSCSRKSWPPPRSTQIGGSNG